MENDDHRVEVEDEGGGPPHGSRGTDRIRLRDFDRIQEREPFQLRPVHIKTGIALALTLILAGLVAGWMIGRSERLGKTTKHDDSPVGSTIDHPGQPVIPAGAGQNLAAGTPEVPAGGSNDVRGRVLPLPSPAPRGSDAPIATRRSQVEVPATGKDASEDATVSNLWPGLLGTTCEGELSFAPTSDPVAVPDTEGELSFAPTSDPVTVPDTEGELSFAPTSDPVAVSDTDGELSFAPTSDPVPVPDTEGELSFAPTPDPVTVPDTEGELSFAPTPDPVTVPDTEGELSFAPTSDPVPVKVSKASASESAKTAAPTKRYVVQIRSFKEKRLANEFAEQIRQKGYNPFIVPYTDAAGTTWYRVRTGSFDNAAAAATFAADLNAKESEKSIPVEVK